MGLLDRLKGLVGLGDGGSPFTSSGDNFVCASCRTTFRRQHHECPQCGGPIVVPIEETDVDEDVKGF
ncbi:MAG: hypothetical protein ABEI39_01595 [Halobacteriales archaeon]